MNQQNNPMAYLNANKPKWDSSLGYLFLLDDLIKLACGYLIAEDYGSYYRTLEAWYLSLVYWVEKEHKKDITEKEFNDLKALREAADPSQPKVLKNYHEALDKLSNKAGLRLKATEAVLGVLKQ